MLLYFWLSSCASASRWSDLTPLPHSRSQHTLISVYDSLLAIGGLPSPNAFSPLASMDVYSIQKNTWAAGASLSLGRFGMGGSVLSTSTVYVFGGYTDNVDFNITDSVEQYNYQTTRWSSAPALPLPLAGVSVVFVPSYQKMEGIVIAGGFSANNICSEKVFIFDGTKYDVFPPMKFARGLASLLLSSHYLYILGGSGDNAPALNTVETCDLGSVCFWKESTDSPKARNLGAGVAVGLVLYAIGGFDPEIKVLASVDLFNVTDPTSQWNEGPALPKPRAGAAAATLNGTIYLCGGFNVLNTTFDDSFLKLQL